MSAAARPAVVLSAFALAIACSGGPSAPPPGGGTLTVEVLPNPLNLSVGGSGTLTAVARSSSGGAVSSTFSWSSQSPVVATVTGGGVVTGHSPGTTLVVATTGTAQGAAVVNVMQGAAVSLEVVPPTASIDVGASMAYSVIARDVTGAIVPAPPVTWSSSQPNVASIGQTGQAQGLANGTTQIGATSGGLVALPATLNVGSPSAGPCDDIASIEIFRITMDLDWARTGTISGNRSISAEHHIRVATDLTRVSAVSEAIWEGPPGGTAAVADSDTNLNGNPPTTTRWDGQGQIASQAAGGIPLRGPTLNVELATCTYYIETSPWIQMTITEPSGSTSSAVLPVGTIWTERRVLGQWRAFGLSEVGGLSLGVHSPTWLGYNIDLGAYVPQAPGQLFLVGTEGPNEAPAGTATLTWAVVVVR